MDYRYKIADNNNPLMITNDTLGGDMLKLGIFNAALVSAAVLSVNAYALEYGQPLTTSVVVTKPGSPYQKKNVMLMNIHLSQHESKVLYSYKPKSSLKMASNYNLPASVNLKMNNVPVLDQGMHGSCATFATTAAIDAVIGKGDYVSQLCHLALGSYLEKNGYFPSGWNGSSGPYVMDQLMRFGVVSKTSQLKKTCGGLNQYPTKNMTEEGKPMSIEEYKEISEDISGKLYVVQHLNTLQRFESRFADMDVAEKVLTQIKTGIMHGHRSLIGVLLKMSPYCSAAARYLGAHQRIRIATH
jgi:hypothetical protein